MVKKVRIRLNKNAYRETPEGREKWLASQKRYRESAKAKATRAAYHANRYSEDQAYKLEFSMRNRIRNALRRYKNGQRGGSAIRDLGCSLPEFIAYIESLWQPGMSWENYYTDWQIDHIRAISLFDITDPEQFKQAVHYTNQQPLFTAEHLAKTRLDRELIRQKAA